MIVVWMPVYNEARNLQKAIDSVLAQTFTDFKLVISNNFSTDGSDQIIDAAVARDSRVVKVMPPAGSTCFLVCSARSRCSSRPSVSSTRW